MVFPVVMYGCESWTIKKAEHQRIDAFKLWCWRRLLRVPWTARKSKVSPEYSLEGLMLKLKLQYFGPLMWRADSLEKTLMLGKIEGRRKRGRQRMRWLDGITRWTWVWASSGSWWWTGKPGVLQSLGSQSIRHDWVIELNWKKWNNEEEWAIPLQTITQSCLHSQGVLPCTKVPPGPLLFVWGGGGGGEAFGLLCLLWVSKSKLRQLRIKSHRTPVLCA